MNGMMCTLFAWLCLRVLLSPFGLMLFLYVSQSSETLKAPMDSFALQQRWCMLVTFGQVISRHGLLPLLMSCQLQSCHSLQPPSLVVRRNYFPVWSDWEIILLTVMSCHVLWCYLYSCHVSFIHVISSSLRSCHALLVTHAILLMPC